MASTVALPSIAQRHDPSLPRRWLRCSRFSSIRNLSWPPLAKSRRGIQPLEDRRPESDLMAMARTSLQPDFFAAETLPEGFAYGEDRIDAALEQALLQELERLPFKPFEFHGFFGNRRVVSYGWRYDYAGRALKESDPLPDFLLPLRDIAGSFARRPAESFQQALVTEYAPGAGIGWH